MSHPPQGYNPNVDPRYAQRNSPAPPFPMPSRDYDAESELGDHYASQNSSTTRLAGGSAFYDHPSGKYFLSSHALHSLLHLTANDSDIYARNYNASVDSHASAQSASVFHDSGIGSSDHYPAWSADRQIPMSTEEIEDIFLDLTQKFGFQRDSMRNMVHNLLLILIILPNLSLV